MSTCLAKTECYDSRLQGGFMRRLLAWLGFVSLFALVGCSGNKNVFDPDGGADDDATADEGGIIMTGDSGDGPTCDYRCSADLHTVVDCNNKVVMMCPDTQGCDPVSGGCIPACDSAKANRGSVGCEFYSLPPNQGFGSCFAVYVANTWSSPVTLSVAYQNQNLPVGNFTAT